MELLEVQEVKGILVHLTILVKAIIKLQVEIQELVEFQEG